MIWSQLPSLVLVQVLGYLPLSDQLSARRVCRYWQLVNDSFVSRRELILFCKIHPRPVYWQHDQRAADLSNGLMVNFQLLESEFFSVYFRKVQRLMLAFQTNTPNKPFIEQIQTSFTGLQHLQFTSIGNRNHFCLPRALQSEFRLENLRTFYAQDADVPLNLNCPKLSELFVRCDLIIDETTNEQTKKCLRNLRLLRVYRLAYSAGFEFSQLEVLYLENPPIFLLDFPLLKELHCLTHGELRDEVLVEELLQQKERLKREHLRIYFRGFDLEEQTFSYIFQGSFDFNAESLRLAKESRSSCNFSLEGRALDLSDSSDDELAGLKVGELPECLLRSITGIQIRKLSKVSPAFFEISDRFPYIQSVTCDSRVGQTLLDRLPDVLPRLESFTYRSIFFLIEIISFKFVTRFKSLNFFSACNRLITTGELKLILQNCKLLGKVAIFKYYFEGVCLDIEPMGKPERRIYKLDWRRVTLASSVDFARTSFDQEELFNYLEASKWMQSVLST